VRNFGQIRVGFWPEIQGVSDQSKLLACYLQTCQHGNGLGCFRLPAGYVTTDIGWEIVTYKEAISELAEAGILFISNDWVFVPEVLATNPIKNTNIAKGVLKIFNDLPDLPFLHEIAVALQSHREFMKRFDGIEADHKERMEQHLKSVSKQSQNSKQTVSKQLANGSETVPEQSRNGSETVSEPFATNDIDTDTDITKTEEGGTPGGQKAAAASGSPPKRRTSKSSKAPPISQEMLHNFFVIYNRMAKRAGLAEIAEWPMNPRLIKALKNNLRRPYWAENWQAALEQVPESEYLTQKINEGSGMTVYEFLRADMVEQIMAKARERDKGAENEAIVAALARGES